MRAVRPSASSRALLVAAAISLAAGCNADGPAGGPQSAEPAAPVSIAAAADVHNATRFPRPKNSQAELAAIQRRHYPQALLAKGIGGAALVDVTVDERGAVRGVALVDAAPTAGVAPGVQHRVVLRSRPPGSSEVSEREVMPGHDNAAFGPAAVAAVREMRFEPATRDGAAVATTFRMTMAFTPRLAQV